MSSRSPTSASSARSASCPSDISSMTPAGGRAALVEQRLAHHGGAGDDLLHALDEVALVDPLVRVGPGLGGGDLRRLEHGVLDVAAAPRIAPRRAPGNRRRRPAASSAGWSCTCQIRSRSSTLGISNRMWVRIRRSKAGSMLAARLVAKMTTPGKVSSSCSSTLTTELASRSTAACMEANRRPAMASASSKNSTASCRSAARNTEATCLAVCPTQRDSSSAVADHEQLPVERVGQGLGADGLAGARRPGEVERQARGRSSAARRGPTGGR